MNRLAWRNVTRQRSCEVCGKADWCRWSDDGCIECHRVTDDMPGYRLLKVTQSGFGLYRRLDDIDTRKSTSAGVPADPKRLYPALQSAISGILQWPSFKGGRHTNTWDYHCADGALAFHVAHFDFPDGDKQFRPICPVDEKWAIADPPGRLPWNALSGSRLRSARQYTRSLRRQK